MADHEIKTKLKLQGEDEYNSKLKASYQQLRVLNSELKREQSALKSSATEQEKAKVKADALRKKIEQQKKIVKVLQDALKQAKTQFKDNVQVQNEWQIKLNRATTVLNNMTNQLDDVGSRVENFNNKLSQTGNQGVQAMVSVNDTVESLKQVFTDIGSLVQGVFSGIANNIATTVQTASELISGAMADAAQWTGISEMYGGNTADIEKYFRTASYAGFSGSDVTTLINKLVQNTHSGNKDTAAALKKLGIDEDGYSNHWDYYTAVWEALMALDENTRMTTAGDLFGDRYGSKINGMVNNWGRGSDEYQRNLVDTGVALSAEEIATMNDANNKINEILTTWEAIQTKLGTELWIKLNMDEKAEQILTLLDDVAKLMFSNGNKAEIVGKLTIDLQTFLTGLFTGVGDLSTYLQEVADALKTSDDSTVQNIGSIVQSIADMLDWISKHSDLITSALNAWVNFQIADIKTQLYTGLKIEDIIGYLGKIAVGVATIAGVKGAGNALQSLLNGGTSTAGTAVVANAATKGGLFSTIGSALASTVAKVAGGVATGAAVMLQSVFPQLQYSDKDKDIISSLGVSGKDSSAFAFLKEDYDAWKASGMSAQEYYQTYGMDGIGGGTVWAGLSTNPTVAPQYNSTQVALVDELLGYANNGTLLDYEDRVDDLMTQIETAFGVSGDDAINSFWDKFWQRSDPEGDNVFTNPYGNTQITLQTKLDGAVVARQQLPYLREMLIEDFQTR